MRAELPDQAIPSPRPYNFRPMVYAGPTVNFTFGKIWWSLGGYFRATDFGRVMQPGDPFGNVWLRTVIGVEF